MSTAKHPQVASTLGTAIPTPSGGLAGVPCVPPPGARAVHVLPVTGVPEIRQGDDLAALLAPALQELEVREGDVLCVSTKVVSKALGLRVAASERDAAIASAAVRTVARRRHTHVVTSVVQIPSGPVMAAAGIDSSNAPDGPLLLPEDPDSCARDLRERLVARLGVPIGVLLTDTSSRIWRVGVGDIALGAAGVASLQDLRGGVDANGRPLSVTVRDLADELAGAADLVKGKSSGVPAAVVRGVLEATAEDVPARALSRTGEDDWFRRPSLESVWVALGLTAEQEPIAMMSPEPAADRVRRALAVASLPRPGEAARRATARLVHAVRPQDALLEETGEASAAPVTSPRTEPGSPSHVLITPAGPEPEDWLAAGALAERIRTALGAESFGAPLPPLPVEIDSRPDHPDHPQENCR